MFVCMFVLLVCCFSRVAVQVIDLLNSNQRTYLAVRWSRHKGFYVENLFHVECESIEDLFAVLEEGKLFSLERRIMLRFS